MERKEDRLAEFGRRVRELRESIGLSRTKLAAKLEVDPTTLYRWEKGDIPASLEQMQAMHALAAEHNLLPQIFPILDFETVFFCGDLWREEGHEDDVYLRAVLRNVPGIAAKVLTVIAEHGGNVLRLAGFQEGDQQGQSIFRVLFTLARGDRLAPLRADLDALASVISTDYPARQTSRLDRE